jgi:transcriptional regulator with XRE-family HTH domain
LDYSLIGKKIKELRKIVGLTQGELAEEICTQALVSRIEKGDIYPSAAALYQISKKLGVDVNYFFEIGTTPRLDYIKEVEGQLRKLRTRLMYEDIIEIVKLEEKNPLFKNSPVNLQLLYWHKGIYINEIEKDRERALEQMKAALLLTYDPKKVMSEREMSISISMGIIEFSRERYDEAMKVYNKVRQGLTLTDHLHDKAIKTRVLYNTARVLTRQGEYDKSIKYCEEALRWIIEVEHLYGFAQLNYHIGYNLELQGQLHEAVSYFDKAALLCEIQNNHKLASFIINKREELLLKVGKG